MASVLVVDDQAANRDLLATVVGSAGHAVRAAVDAEAGLALARREPPDLIISDILMPGIDGYEFVRQLRSDPELAATRVVFYTATYLEDEVRTLAAGCGVEHFLFKPCEPEEILEVVSSALNAEASARAPFAATSFDREHIRLLNDKLIAKVDELEELNDHNQRLNEELRASEVLYRVLFDRNPQPMLAYDRATLQIIAANDALLGNYGYSRDELMSMTIKDLRPPEDVEILVEFLAQDPGLAQLGVTEYAGGRPWRHRYKDGTIIEVAVTSDNATLAGRECRIAVYENVTERNRAAAELAIAHDEVVAASNLKSAFLANMSHEIRTPMNGVIGMNELLLESDLDAEQRDFAELIRRSAEQMMVIIDDILDISRIETGQLELDLAEFSIREVVEQACAVAAPEAAAKGLAYDVRFSDQVPDLVRGDARRWRQIVLNLVFNAVKFTREGSVAVSVGTRAAAQGGEVIRVEVSDTGIGIEPAVLDRMFEPFTQADVSHTRAYGGTGLGLAIARELVDLMGGSIGAVSEPGRGSAFWVELAADPRRAREPPHQAHTEAAALRLGPNAPLVLVAEDTPVNQIVAMRVLERCGCRCEIVGNGIEALQALSSQHFDLVLMDCQMPELDGYATTRELRRREQGHGHTPVVAMTAHAMKGDREKCLEAGMDDYLSKPIRHDALDGVLARWLRPSQTRTSARPPAAS